MEFATQKHFDMVKKQDMKENKELNFFLLTLIFIFCLLLCKFHMMRAYWKYSYKSKDCEPYRFSYSANAFNLSVLHASDLVLSLILLIGLITV